MIITLQHTWGGNWQMVMEYAKEKNFRKMKIVAILNKIY